MVGGRSAQTAGGGAACPVASAWRAAYGGADLRGEPVWLGSSGAGADGCAVACEYVERLLAAGQRAWAPPEARRVWVGAIRPLTHQTPYVRWGDFWVYGCALVLAWGVVFRSRVREERLA